MRFQGFKINNATVASVIPPNVVSGSTNHFIQVDDFEPKVIFEYIAYGRLASAWGSCKCNFHRRMTASKRIYEFIHSIEKRCILPWLADSDSDVRVRTPTKRVAVSNDYASAQQIF